MTNKRRKKEFDDPFFNGEPPAWFKQEIERLSLANRKKLVSILLPDNKPEENND